MTITGPKPVTRSQQVSMLALKSLRAADDVRVMGYVAELIALEARPVTIHTLTGVPGQVIRRMYEREVIRPMTGRKKETIGDLLFRPRQHLEVSFFVARYVAAWHSDGRQVSAPGFIRAYRQYLRVASEGTVMNPEAAFVLAQMWHDDKIENVKCTVCGVPWVKSRADIRIGWSHGKGDCPFCRSLVSKDPKRATLAGREIRQSRKNFERLMQKAPS